MIRPRCFDSAAPSSLCSPTAPSGNLISIYDLSSDNYEDDDEDYVTQEQEGEEGDVFPEENIHVEHL